MVMTIENDMLRSADTIRTCRVCGKYMITGYLYEYFHFHYFLLYYCSEECLNKGVSKDEQELGFEEGTLYYDKWYDSEVFVVFDNQYAKLEDAEYIKENHGNCFTKIEVKTLDLKQPVYKIVDGKQIEIDELTFI